MNTVENRIVDPSQWDEIGPLLDGGILRPYEELRRMPYYAPPGFYADEQVLAFQPGWDGQDGCDAVHWYAPDWPTVGQVREKIASLLVSSWLVQDRDDAADFYLGNDGSIEAPWGIIPPHILFAPRPGADDAPWENLRSILADVDAALEAGAPDADGFVGWRLRNAVTAKVKTEFYTNPDGQFVVTFRIKNNNWDVPIFVWNADGTPWGGEVQEYAPGGVVGLYEAHPLPFEADLEVFLAVNGLANADTH